MRLRTVGEAGNCCKGREKKGGRETGKGADGGIGGGGGGSGKQLKCKTIPGKKRVGIIVIWRIDLEQPGEGGESLVGSITYRER